MGVNGSCQTMDCIPSPDTIKRRKFTDDSDSASSSDSDSESSSSSSSSNSTNSTLSTDSSSAESLKKNKKSKTNHSKQRETNKNDNKSDNFNVLHDNPSTRISERSLPEISPMVSKSLSLRSLDYIQNDDVPSDEDNSTNNEVNIIDDDDLPAMPENNPSNDGQFNTLNIFDSPPIGFDALFDNNYKTDIMDNTPSSAITSNEIDAVYNDNNNNNNNNPTDFKQNVSINASSLDYLNINDEDPNAVAPSPPVHSIYKPLSGTVFLSQLSQITESTTNESRLSSLPSTQSIYVSSKSKEIISELPGNIDTELTENNTSALNIGTESPLDMGATSPNLINNDKYLNANTNNTDKLSNL